MNQYHIYDVIGRGKHSTVYKGRKKKTIEYHAIKSVEKSQKTKVLQEVRTLHSLDHNNVLKFYAWYETSAHLWLVLEYCVGGDLLTLLRQDTRLPEESIHDFARDLVQALQFLHSKGVIYCDLKPSNVLLDENGRLKLCDFGLARRLSDIAKSSVQELPQTKRGTPCYMAPELFQEGSVHSYGSDLWALGCVMYECYTGRPPFVSNSFTQLVHSIISDPMPEISGNPSPEFQHLLSRLLVKDPVERIQWDELRNHPFWRTKCRELPLPPQPALTNFLRLTHRSSSPVEKPLSSGGSTVEKRAPDSRGVMVDRATLREKVQNLPKKPESKYVGQDAKGVPENRNPGHRENGRKMTKGLTGKTQPKQLEPKSNRGAPAVNVLRLSKIVKTNLLKETENDTYRQQSTANGTSDDTDVTLENHDLELNFGEGAESDPTEEEDEAGSNGSSPTASAEEKDLHKTSAKPTHAPAAKGNSRGSSNGAEESLPVTPTQSESNGSTENHLLTHVEIEGKQVDAMRHVAASPSGLGIPRKGSHRATPGIGELSKEAVDIPRNPSRPLVVLSQSLWHPSDLSVRPIMLNRRIEKVPESTFDSRILPAERLVSTEFVKLDTEHQEVFLNKIMGNICGSTVSMNEKINTLKFVETLCTNIDAANKLINGPLMLSLVKLLRTVKFAALRVRLASVMGLLIRHATLIEEELAGSGIVAVLTETLRDKQDKVRRCAMATLGELLFYVATQNEGPPRAAGGHDNSTNYGKSSMWQIPGTTIALVASILRRGEDDVTQHYALKTIENIASQGGEWAQRFTSNEVIDNLCYTFRAAAKPGNLRATAGSCLVRLVRFQPITIPVVLERLTLKDLVGGLGKGTGREQQVNINLLNMVLVGSSVLPMSKYLHALVEERSLFFTVVSMLEQGPEILRGKALVCAALLCKNRRWLPSLCNAKLLPAVDKLSKEKDPYVQQCIEALVQTTAGVVPTILDSICTDITQLARGRRTPGPGSSPARGTPRSSLPLFPVILNLVNSPTFRARMIDESVLEKLASFLKRLETSSFQGQDEIQSTLLQIVEVMSQQSTTLLTFPDIFIAKVLPSLAVLYEKNTDGDVRFLCLKVFFDSLVVFLDDISPVNAVEDRQPSSTVLSTPRREKLEVIVKQHFIPMYPILVEDEDPIPMYAQKLLVMLLDLKCIQIEDILQLKLISQFFKFLQCDLASINLHNVRLCLHLASSSKVGSKVLSDLRIVSHVGALLDFVHAKGMQDFLDPVLSVCRSLLIRNVEDGLELDRSNAASASSANGRKLSVSVIQDIGDLGQHATIFLELCGSREPQVAEAAAECLVLLLKTAPRSSAGAVFSSVGRFGNLLETCARSHTPSISAKLQSKLLFAISASCKEVREAQLLQISHPSSADLVSLENIVGRLCKSSASQVAEAAGVAAFELQRVNHSAYSIVNRSRIELTG